MIIKREFRPSLTLFDSSDLINPINGVENLNPALTINGVTVYPTLRYNGKHATSTVWQPWGYGEVLDLVAGTAPTYNIGSPLNGKMDDSVLFNNGGYYVARNNTFGNIGLNDFVLEVVFQHFTASSSYVINKRENAGNTQGWSFEPSAAGNCDLYLLPAGFDGNPVRASGLVNGAWYHVIFFCDRSGNGKAYLNGVLGGTQSLAADTATLDKVTPLQIGHWRTATPLYSIDSLAYVALWQGAAWLDAGTSWQSIATERINRLIGIYPKQSRGTASPTTATRNSVAIAGKMANGSRKLYQVGANWGRTSSKIDLNGKLFVGAVQEPSRVQNVKYSNEFTTGWTATELTATPLVLEGPLGTSTMASIIPANNARRQRILKTPQIAFTAGTKYCTSIKVSKGTLGNANYISIGSGNDATVDMARVTFNLLTNEIKLDTVRGPAEAAYIEDYGNGVKKLIVVDTCVASGNEYGYIIPADNLTDEQIIGDGATPAFYVSAMQVEAGDYASTYMSSSSTTVTRSADSLIYSGLGNVGNIGSNGQGRMEFEFLIPNYDASAFDWVRLSNAGNANEQIKIAITANDFISLVTTSNGGVNTGTVTNAVDVCDGKIHKVIAVWQNNLIQMSIDGVLVGTSTTCGNMPTGLDRINIDPSLGIISNFKIYPFAKPIGEK